MKVILLLLLVASTGFGQSSSRFSMTRNIIAGGGTAVSSSSSRFRLAGTVAQPLAAVPASSRFSVQGGFWIWSSPILFGPTKVGTNFLVSIQSELGKTYALQYLDALGSSWQSLPPITGNGTVITVTNSVVGATSRFYRLVEQQ
jgi:hypothetical protein